MSEYGSCSEQVENVDAWVLSILRSADVLRTIFTSLARSQEGRSLALATSAGQEKQFLDLIEARIDTDRGITAEGRQKVLEWTGKIRARIDADILAEQATYAKTRNWIGMGVRSLCSGLDAEELEEILGDEDGLSSWLVKFLASFPKDRRLEGILLLARNASQMLGAVSTRLAAVDERLKRQNQRLGQQQHRPSAKQKQANLKSAPYGLHEVRPLRPAKFTAR